MRSSNDYTDLYYSEIYGEYPGDESYNKTKLVFDYLIDVEIYPSVITRLIFPCKEYIEFSDLPDNLWENSLIKRNAFYYHNKLRLKQEMPTWNPLTNKSSSNKLFMEMQIQFTLEDLMDYYYRSLRLDSSFSEYKKDSGAFKYLLGKYSKFDFIESLDFILSLIDYVKSNVNYGELFDILTLQNYESEVYEMLKPVCEEAKANGRSKIIWRTAGS